MTTVAPSLASSRAMANPIPVPPPVMIPTRFSNVFSGSMARDDTSGVEKLFDRGDDLVKIGRGGFPQAREIDAAVAVKQLVAHSAHTAPVERNHFGRRRRDVPRRFSDDA